MVVILTPQKLAYTINQVFFSPMQYWGFIKEVAQLHGQLI